MFYASRTQPFCLLLILMGLLAASQSLQPAAAQKNEGPYEVDPASVKNSEVPAGKIIEGTFSDSAIFPGTTRRYAIYIPSQYDAATPACLMVFQDGMKFIRPKGDWKAPTVFDNLIHAGDMPVTIGLFVEPGVVPAANEDSQARYNRSFEYDSVDDRYADFLLKEMIPLIEKDYSISKSPNDRGICGSSSGGIAAFNVAWQRPDQFRRVSTTVGTYVGLRGANELSALVRKTEPKPLRVFLQDGSNDLNIYCGDWWVANQGMLSALKFSGYEVDHQWGKGGHNGKHGGAIFPKAMRSIWKGWPEAVTTHLDRCSSRASQILLDDETWSVVSKGHKFLGAVTTDDAGNVYFAERGAGKIFKLDAAGEQSVFWLADTANDTDAKGPFIGGLATGADGAIYATLPRQKRVVKFSSTGEIVETLADTIEAGGIVVAEDGTAYFTQSKSKSLWVKLPGKDAQIAASEFFGANGITLSADQTQVLISGHSQRHVWSGVRAENGNLKFMQPYFYIHSPPAAVDMRPLCAGMCVSKEGWLLVATKMGIQVCDQPGRVNFIIPPPPKAVHPTSICFGGGDGQTIYATSGGRLLKRKLKIVGAMPWQAPVTPPKPRL